MKKIIISIFSSIMLLGLFISNKCFAYSSIAEVKGYELEGMEYVAEKSIDDVKMISSSNNLYGYYSLWVSHYRFITAEIDGSYSLYLVFFVESNIQSIGKSSGDYYRNKNLDVKLTYSGFSIVDWYETIDNNARVSYTKTGGMSFTGGYNGKPQVSGSVSFSYSKTASYSAVSTTISKNASEKYMNYHYHFNNWNDGGMKSPNIGLVSENTYMIGFIPNINLSILPAYSYEFTVSATIFRDRKWPKENYTMTRSSVFKGNNSYLV